MRRAAALKEFNGSHYLINPDAVVALRGTYGQAKYPGEKITEVHTAAGMFTVEGSLDEVSNALCDAPVYEPEIGE